MTSSSLVSLGSDRDVRASWRDLAERDEDAAFVNGFVRVGGVDCLGTLVDETDRGEVVEHIDDAGLDFN